MYGYLLILLFLILHTDDYFLFAHGSHRSHGDTASHKVSVIPCVFIQHKIQKKNMNKSKWSTVIQFIITVLTAIASAFCVPSCRG